MLYTPTIISIIEVLVVTVPVLLTVAFVTVAERKTMASMQRRLGPNVVGYYGLLQAFADALKLILKEYVSPTQANLILFFLGPVITLIFSLLGYAVVPYGPGLALWDFNLGILYMLAVSSLATYGILLAGWSINLEFQDLEGISRIANFNLKISVVCYKYLPYLYLFAILLYLFNLGYLLLDGYLCMEGSPQENVNSSSCEGGAGNGSEGGGRGPRPNQEFSKLPISNSNNSMLSNVSYTKSDIDMANAIDIVNFKNILDDPVLSSEEKHDKVIQMFTSKCNQLSESKQKISDMKNTGVINIGFTNKK